MSFTSPHIVGKALWRQELTLTRHDRLRPRGRAGCRTGAWGRSVGPRPNASLTAPRWRRCSTPASADRVCGSAEVQVAESRQRPESSCKPGSVSAGALAATNILLGRALPRASSELTRRHGPGRPRPPARAGGPPPYSLLHRVGFAVPPRSPGARCALAAPFHPCHARPLARSRAPARLPRRSAVCSLLHFPAGHPDRPLAGTLPCGARTFLGGPFLPSRRVRPDDSGEQDVARGGAPGNAGREWPARLRGARRRRPTRPGVPRTAPRARRRRCTRPPGSSRSRRRRSSAGTGAWRWR